MPPITFLEAQRWIVDFSWDCFLTQATDTRHARTLLADHLEVNGKLSRFQAQREAQLAYERWLSKVGELEEGK